MRLLPFINLQAQRDLNSLVKNDERRRVNRDRTTTIDKDETITVHGFRKEVVDKDEHITIHQNRTEVVDKDETITIHQNRQERVDKDETIDIGGNRTETVHKSEQITIKGNRDKTVKGNDTLTVNKDRKETVNKSRSLTVDKTNTEFVKLGKSVTVGLGYATQVGTVMNTAVGVMQTEQIGRIKKSFVGKSYSITAGDEFKITVGKSSLVMNADGSIIITGSSIVTQAEKENKVIGKDVLINPPGASNSQVEEAEPDYLNDEPPEIGPDGLPILGSDYGNLQTEQFMNRQAGNINKNVMNNNGSIHSGSMPAYQQAQNKKTFDAAVTVIGVAAGGGSATILYKGSRLVVSKKALDLARKGKQSVSALIKNAKKAVPNKTSVPKAMAGGAGGSAAFDFGSQKLLSPDIPYDPRKTAVSAGIGALGGAGGSTIANAAKVPYATALNIPKTIKNSTSMKILKQQKAAETVGKTAGKAAIDESDNE